MKDKTRKEWIQRATVAVIVGQPYKTLQEFCKERPDYSCSPDLKLYDKTGILSPSGIRYIFSMWLEGKRQLEEMEEFYGS